MDRSFSAFGWKIVGHVFDSDDQNAATSVSRITDSDNRAMSRLASKLAHELSLRFNDRLLGGKKFYSDLPPCVYLASARKNSEGQPYFLNCEEVCVPNFPFA